MSLERVREDMRGFQKGYNNNNNSNDDDDDNKNSINN